MGSARSRPPGARRPHSVAPPDHPRPAEAPGRSRLAGAGRAGQRADARSADAASASVHSSAAVGPPSHGLTRDDIPSPSAHDRARNKHRSGIAWNKFAVRAILINPRYTGYQVWNKQRKDEVPIDVEDVALGHTTKLRWNEAGKWIWSDKIVHPPIIDRETFDQVRPPQRRRPRPPRWTTR
jgi:site-specific DNA recombinase